MNVTGPLWEAISVLFPPLTRDAELMVAAVEANPADKTIMLVCVDALEESGATFQAILMRMRLSQLEMVEAVMATWANIPPLDWSTYRG